MSEEEKEAINNVDKFVDTIMVIIPEYSTKIPEYCIKEEDWLSIKKVLNLIEKLQKENKELKEENIILKGNKIGYKLAIQKLKDDQVWSEATIEGLKERFIPKEKVKRIRDKAECEDYYSLIDVIDDLSKLIGDYEEDKE